MKIKQLSFDDIIDNRLEVGNTVEVVAVPDEKQDVETFYYLKEFTGKKGVLTRIGRGRRTISFEVEFSNGQIGIFYEHEIRKVEGGKRSAKTIGKSKKSSSRTKRKK